MAFDSCMAEIRKAAGRELSKEEQDELDELLDQIHSRAQRRTTMEKGESAEDALRHSAKEVMDELRQAKLKAAANKARNMQIKVRSLAWVKQNFADDYALGFEALLAGVNRNVAGAGRSVVAAQKELAIHFKQGLLGDLEREGVATIFERGHLDREVTRELHAFDRLKNPARSAQSVTGSAEALKIAKVLHKWEEIARIKANNAGAWIKPMAGYIVRQGHSARKISKAGFQKWRDTIVPLLDERTFDGVTDREGWLKSVYAALASGVHVKASGAAPPGTGLGHQNIAKLMSEGRLLHFAGGDAWFQYNSVYGTGSLRESLMSGLDHAAHNVGLMQRMGPNPRANFDEMMQTLLRSDELLNPETRVKLQQRQKRLSDLFDLIDGSANIASNKLGAVIGSSIRAVQSTSKLGFAVASAFSDIPIAAAELQYQGRGFFSSFHDVMKGWRHLTPGARREMASVVGVTMDGIQGALVDRFSGADVVPGAMAKGLRFFFKWSGLTGWTDTMRLGVAMGMTHHLALNRGAAWGKLKPEIRRVLERFDVSPQEWDALRGMDMYMDDLKRAYMVPENVSTIPDNVIAKLIQADRNLDPRRAARRIEDKREELRGKLGQYLADRADFAVIVPDARSQLTTTLGTRPGTVLGELVRLIMQFKSFPLTLGQKVLGRELHKGEGVKGSAAGIAKIILLTTMFGYVSMSAKDVAKGREPRDPLTWKTFSAAMLQGGGWGIYGDFLFGDIRSRFGRSPLETFLGPTAGTAGDLLDLAGRLRDGDDLAAQAFRVFWSHMPGGNVFYTKAALDYLMIYEIQEALNPGYLKRMERRIKDENDQEFFFPPSRQ